jgi:hypothetical protein
MPRYFVSRCEEHRRIVEVPEKRDLGAAAIRLYLKSIDHAMARRRPLHPDYFVEWHARSLKIQ